MATKCFSLVRGRVLRVTKLDGCGAVSLGPTSMVTSDGFITVTFTANTDEGETISVTNAAGRVCILDEPCPKFTGYDVEVAFCGVDPDLYALMTGQPVVLDGATPTPNAVGFKMNTDVDACATGFALELWSNVPSAVCAPGTGVSYGYMLIPFLKGGVIGDFTIGNDAVNFTMTGAKSKDGNAWGVGPYKVVPNATGASSTLLTALAANDHLLVQLTTIAPPAATCGGAAVGVPATSAVAGIPGNYLPANSYAPANLAAATGLTASPATAWTAGQYVTLRDGSLMHWSSSAWVVGPG
jgi:hypothetical protein